MGGRVVRCLEKQCILNNPNPPGWQRTLCLTLVSDSRIPALIRNGVQVGAMWELAVLSIRERYSHTVSAGKETKLYRCGWRPREGRYRTSSLYHVERRYQAKQISVMGLQKGFTWIYEVR